MLTCRADAAVRRGRTISALADDRHAAAVALSQDTAGSPGWVSAEVPRSWRWSVGARNGSGGTAVMELLGLGLALCKSGRVRVVLRFVVQDSCDVRL